VIPAIFHWHGRDILTFFEILKKKFFPDRLIFFLRKSKLLKIVLSSVKTANVFCLQFAIFATCLLEKFLLSSILAIKPLTLYFSVSYRHKRRCSAINNGLIRLSCLFAEFFMET